MVIWCTFAKVLKAPVVPLTVAKQVLATPVLSEPNFAVPKFARGKTPPLLEGASAIHSADEACARLTFEEVVKL